MHPPSREHSHYEDGEVSLHASSGRIVRIGNHPHAAGGLVVRLKKHYAPHKDSLPTAASSSASPPS